MDSMLTIFERGFEIDNSEANGFDGFFDCGFWIDISEANGFDGFFDCVFRVDSGEANAVHVNNFSNRV